MKRFMIVILVALLTLSSAGCVGIVAPVQPPKGFLCTVYKAPLTVSYKETPVCKKTGKASTFFFWDVILTGMSFGWGEAGIEDAAREGGLQTVEYVDYELVTVLMVFGKFTIIAHGT